MLIGQFHIFCLAARYTHKNPVIVANHSNEEVIKNWLKSCWIISIVLIEKLDLSIKDKNFTTSIIFQEIL